MFGLFKSKSTTAHDRASAAAHRDHPRPDVAAYIVGDVLGQSQALEGILARIDAHIGDSGARDPHLIFLGNYLHPNGGAIASHGRATLARLMELQAEFPQNVICLMGAQERMLLDALDDPQSRMARWLRAGAGRFLAEFALSGEEAPQTIAEQITASLGQEVIDWIARLPLYWQSGNLAALHAGADPHHPITAQKPRILLWGHPEFDLRPRKDGIWIAHGHSRCDGLAARDGRIGLNLAVDQTRHLAAVALTPAGDITFLST